MTQDEKVVFLQHIIFPMQYNYERANLLKHLILCIILPVSLAVLLTSLIPLLLFLLLFFETVEHTAGDEGHGHEEDDGRTDNRHQHSHIETKVLVSWKRGEIEVVC